MKQHITIEQLNELTEDKLDKLTLWMIHNDYYNNDGICFNIGQMIEFLDEQGKLTINKGQGMNGDDSLVDYYTVVFGHKSLLKAKDIDNLCDALWEVVKEQL